MEEKKIFVVVSETIQVQGDGEKLKTVVQPAGRQIAQACHVVSKLRHIQKPTNYKELNCSFDSFESITTIILQARDSKEIRHLVSLLDGQNLNPVIFADENPEYGPGFFVTSLAVFVAPSKVIGILDYLPLW